MTGITVATAWANIILLKHKGHAQWVLFYLTDEQVGKDRMCDTRPAEAEERCHCENMQGAMSPSDLLPRAALSEHLLACSSIPRPGAVSDHSRLSSSSPVLAWRRWQGTWHCH